MPIQDQEFLKRLRATFRVEAEEHLQAITSGLLGLEKSPSGSDQTAAIDNIYREAHSLKGAARAVDMTDIESICQEIESVFSMWKRQPPIPSPGAMDVLHKSLDAIQNLITGQTSSGGSSQVRESLVRQLARLGPTGPGGRELPAAKMLEREAVAPSQAPPHVPERIAGETVRIPIAKLDAQLLRVEDMLPLKSLVAQRADDLHKLTLAMEQWRVRWDKVSSEARVAGAPREDPGMLSDSERGISRQLADFFEWNADFHRSLERKLQLLTAQAGRDRHSIGKRLDELLEDSKKLLMLPFATMADLFPKIVRDLCRELGKEAELVIRGGDVEIDKRILEEMKDAFIHMLRNSIDHGIEPSAERVRRQKAPRGTITIAVSQVNGSKVEIMVSDDGHGINREALKETAIRRGMLAEADARNMSEADALALVFDADISTSRTITNVSGRGLGMAIVRSKVEKLGGQIAIETRRDAGTTLRILLPLTLATFRGVLVAAAGQTFVVPAANVERVMRIRQGEIQTVENRETLSVEGRILSLVRLEAVLELPAKAISRNASGNLSTMILCAAGERMAFVVDEILHEEEVLVKPLRKPLVRVRNLGGTTILGSGKAVPTLNIHDLVKSARIHHAPALQVKFAPASSSAKRVLVVEDSITSRMLLKGILESAGYQVQVAVDGMDAYAQLRETPFDLLVSDVEMPRLNGLDLAAKIRADERLAELPIVLVTALESRAQRERGLEVGANAYIVKSSFDQSNLLEVVRKLV